MTDGRRATPLGTLVIEVASAGAMKPGKLALMPPAGGFGRSRLGIGQFGLPRRNPLGRA